MTRKKRINVYVNEEAYKELRSADVNISKTVNEFLCEKAAEMGRERAKLKEEVEELEEKLVAKKQHLEQLEKKENKLTDYLKKKVAYGNSRIEYYREKKNNGWDEKQKEKFIQETAENAPFSVDIQEVRSKLEGLA